MKKCFLLLILLWVSVYVFAQPTNKVYWVGPTSGANLTDSYWATTSGGAPGTYPNNTDYQLIFDGAGTSSQTYTINLTANTTTTGGFIYATNNTTVDLQENLPGNTFLKNSGLKIDGGSKFIFENTFVGGILTMIFPASPTPVYNGTIDGELVIKSALVYPDCGPFCGGETLLNLSNLLVNSFTTRVITVNGTLRFDGTQAMMHASSNCLNYTASSNLIINSEYTDFTGGTYDPASTIIINGAILPSYAGLTYLTGTGPFGNIIYDCPSQTVTRSLFATSGWSTKGNLTIKNTGTGMLAINGNRLISGNGDIAGSLVFQNSPNVKFYPNNQTALASTLTVTNVDIQSGQFDVSDGGTSTATAIVAVKGNFNNQGIIKIGSTGLPTSEIDFVGTVTQTVVPGTINDPISFRVNGTGGIVLTSDWSLPPGINSKLMLSNGNINMGSNTLIVQNPSPGAINGGSAASHIIGKLRRTTNSAGGNYLFPVDNSTNESANLIISPAGSTTTTYDVFFTRPNPYDRNAMPPGVVYVGNYNWDISRTSGTENANLTFIYGSNNFSSDVPGSQVNYRVLHWNGASWDNLGGFGLNGQITATNVSTFSPFTIGTVSTVLPVQLLNFSGASQGNINLLAWTVTQEINTNKYEIERSSDGRSFQSIGKVDATGILSYTFSDKQPLAGNNFYRLRIEDNDGKTNYSQVIILRSNANGKMQVFPNPALNIINVEYTSTDDKLFIQDETGRVVKTIIISQSGRISLSIDISGLSKGVYFIKAGNESTQFIKR